MPARLADGLGPKSLPYTLTKVMRPVILGPPLLSLTEFGKFDLILVR
jgi:hypothetical protein